MKHERSELALLLGLLLLFSSVLGALHAEQQSNQLTKNQDQQQELKPVVAPHIQYTLPTFPKAPVPSNGEQDLNNSLGNIVKDFIAIITPLALSGSEEQIVKVLHDLPVEQVREIIVNLYERKVVLREVLLPVIFGVSLYYKDTPEEQRKIFSIITDTQKLKQGDIFYSAATSSYPTVIPALLTWAKTNESIAAMIPQSLMLAVERNNLVALKRMYKYGITVYQSLANELLWAAITKKKRASIARFLLKKGADKEYTKNGESVLIAAVNSNQLLMVQALVESGADITRSVKDEVGNALQVIVDKQHTIVSNPKLRVKYPKRLKKMVAIEQYLRKAGARGTKAPLVPRAGLQT